MTVQCANMSDFLASFSTCEVDHIITSPPFIGLPGRGDTRALAETLIGEASRILTATGSLTMIVGAAPGSISLPAELSLLIPEASRGRLALSGMYVWDRTGSLRRDVGSQMVTNDFILHVTRTDHEAEALWPESVIRTAQSGFDYGFGVTTPPDLASLLVRAVSRVGDTIIDPLCGFAEIGLQSLRNDRLFLGCDLDPACVKIANARLEAMQTPGRDHREVFEWAAT